MMPFKIEQRFYNDGNFNHADFLKHKTYYTSTKKHFNAANAWQNLQVLFGNCFDKEYAPKVKDYSATLYWVIKYFYRIHCKQGVSPRRFNKSTRKLFQEILKFSDHYIDGRYNVSEKIRYDVANYYPPAYGSLLPITDILEGYDRWCEFQNLEFMLTFMTEGEYQALIESNKFDELNKKIDQEIKNRSKGIYSNSFGVFENLKFITNIKEYRDTCSAIYELSLMARLHPFLLFEERDVKFEELLVPWRFKTLINWFVVEKKSIEDYKENDQNLIHALDKICYDLGWLKYSHCLKKLYDMYSLEEWNGTYLAIVAKDIIRKKLNGNVFLYDLNEAADIPIVRIYQDIVEVPQFIEYSNYGGDIYKNFHTYMEEMILNIFYKELMTGEKFDSTIFLIKRFFSIADGINEEYASTFLNKIGLSNFIKLNDVYPS